MNNTSWRDVQFVECKMTGADFTNSSTFSSFHFRKSHLQYASFVGMKLWLSKAQFICNLQEAYFDEANLSSALFDRCDMERAEFTKTNLEKADLSTSYHFDINPNTNRIRKARFSKTELEGLLRSFGIQVVD